MPRWILWLALGVVTAAPPAEAHHSVYGVYDTAARVTIDAVITQFHFVNPHPFMLVDVKDGNGQEQPWRLEMDNRSELSAAGVTVSTFKPGDRIIVIGSPAREQSRSLYIQKLDRPADGFQLEQVGGSPRVRPSSK